MPHLNIRVYDFDTGARLGDGTTELAEQASLMVGGPVMAMFDPISNRWEHVELHEIPGYTELGHTVHRVRVEDDT